MEYAKSRELHKALRSVWDLSFKPLGFKRCKGSLASYYRPRKDGNGFVRFWSQASQWGDSWRGNQFTLNVDIAIDDPNSYFGGSDRFLGYLSQSECVEAEKIIEVIVTRKPRPQATHWIYDEMRKGNDVQFWQEAFKRAFVYTPGTIRAKTDVWLPYFSVDDVNLWANFLIEPIPTILDTFERQNKKLGEPM